MRWPCVTGLTSYLSSRFSIAVGRRPFLELPKSGGFAKFASFAHSASLTIPFRATVARPWPCGEVGSPVWCKRAGFVVATVPEPARHSVQDRNIPALLTPSAAVSPPRQKRGQATNGRLPFVAFQGGATRPGRVRDLCPMERSSCDSRRLGGRVSSFLRPFIERFSIYLLQRSRSALDH